MPALEDGGLRERKKAATKEALHAVALRLFADRGFQATTVADIAAAANVSERTFFRYFDSKEDVVLDDVMRALPDFEGAIHSRPATESALVALRQALSDLAQADESRPFAMLYSGPPVTWSGPVPVARLRLMIMLEDRLATALAERSRDIDDDGRYQCAVAARVGIAAIRSALLRFHELGGIDKQSAKQFAALVDAAFDVIAQG